MSIDSKFAVVNPALGDWRDRTPDRYVRGFGGVQHAIYRPVGTPKAREDCQPFTYTLATPDTSVRYPRIPDTKGQEKFAKQLNTLLTKQAREAARKAKAAAKVAA